MMKTAVCVLLPTFPEGDHVLAVSRRHNERQWGLPGGKVDPSESNTQAAVREIKEETGLTIQENLLQPIFSGPCYGADGIDYWVTTYLYIGDWSWHEVIAEEGLQAEEYNFHGLCLIACSPFFEYNRLVLEYWDIFRKQ